MLHGSYGTLAILTRIVFELVPAAHVVELTYHHHRDFAAFQDDMRERCEAGDFDFVDGIVHAPDQLVLCLGPLRRPRAAACPATGAPRSTTGAPPSSSGTTSPPSTTCSATTPSATGSRAPRRRSNGGRCAGWPGAGSSARRTSSAGASASARCSGGSRAAPTSWSTSSSPFAASPSSGAGTRSELDFWPLWIVPYRVDEPYPWIAPGHAAGLAGDLMIDCAVYGKRNNARRRRLVRGDRGEDLRARRDQDADLAQPPHARALLAGLRPRAVGGGQAGARPQRPVQRPVREVPPAAPIGDHVTRGSGRRLARDVRPGVPAVAKRDGAARRPPPGAGGQRRLPEAPRLPQPGRGRPPHLRVRDRRAAALAGGVGGRAGSDRADRRRRAPLCRRHHRRRALGRSHRDRHRAPPGAAGGAGHRALGRALSP